MNINWKLRFKNKPVLMALLGGIVAFVYQILGIVGVVPPVSETDVTQWIGAVLNILVMIGIVVDPTTSGVGDSAMAQSYKTPSNSTEVYEDNVGGDNEAFTEHEHEAHDPEDCEEE